MSRRGGKDPINEEEQQRLRNEEEARRIEALRKEKEQEPIPQSVLQYVSSPLITVPWSPFGFGGDPGVTQDELWEDLGSDVNISYEDMHQILNEDRERAEREESTSDDNGGGGGVTGGEEDIPMPEIMVKMR